MNNTDFAPLLTRRTIAGGLVAALGAAGFRSARAQAAPIRIGVISDQSGPYSAPGGPGSVAGARLAVEDFGQTVLGRPIEILVGDHQNKPDIGVAIVREWLDKQGVTAIADGGSSAVGLAIQNLTRERKKLFLITGSTSNEFTGKQCSPTGFQWQTDTYSTATAAVRGEIDRGRKSFYFLTVNGAVVEVDGGLTAGYLTHRHGADYAVHSLAAQPIMPVAAGPSETP